MAKRINKAHYLYTGVRPKKMAQCQENQNRGVIKDDDGSVLWNSSMHLCREFKTAFKKIEKKLPATTNVIASLEEAEELRNKAKLENPRINISWFNKIETN